jgi:diacylglycerol kinase family enzyme
MRAAAILGLGSSTRDLKPFQGSADAEWVIGLPSEATGLDAILVFGGDGTVHRHLAALVRLALPVLVVPAGSGNDFARALGLLRVGDSLAVWQKFVTDGSNVRTVDLGVLTPLETPAKTAPEADLDKNAEAARRKTCPDTSRIHSDRPESGHTGRSETDPAHLVQPAHSQDSDAQPASVYFSCAAGVGLDGEIARRANALPRWLRGHGGYALSLPGALLGFRPFGLRLCTSQGENDAEFFPRSEQPVVAAVFANTPVYGGGMRVAPRARMDDGQLDVCVIRDIPKLKLLGVFPTVYFGRHLGIREVEYFAAARARVETERPVEVYADGEYVCRTPFEVGVARGALRLIAP